MAVRFLSSENIDGVLTFSTTGTFGNDASITHYTNNYLYIRGGSAGLVVGDNTSATRAEFSSSNFITWEINSNAAMHINSSRNLGVGTSNPNHRLDIYSNENIPLRIHRPSNSNLNSAGAHGIGFSTRSDAITSTTDTRSGIFSYYNGNLFFATNTSDIAADPDGSARMTILNNGYVGIGETNPQSLLEVKQPSVGNSGVTFDADATNRARLEFQVNTNYARIQTYGNGTSNGYLILNPLGNNVAIGTTSPSSGAKLDIDGSLAIANSGQINLTRTLSTSNLWYGMRYDNDEVQIYTYFASNRSITFNTVSGGTTITSQLMKIESGGNVGINTPSPTNLLDIKSNGNSKGLDIHHNNGNIVAQLIHGGSGDEGQLKLYDSNVETVRISGENNIDSYINSGDVGIGTTNPGAKLNVVSTTTPQFKVEYDADRYVEIHHSAIFNVSGAGQSNNFYIGTRGNSGNNNIVFYTGATTGASAGSERFRIDSIGGVYNYQSVNKANTYYGYLAGNYGGTGTGNNAFGYDALRNVSTGTANVGIGRAALFTLSSAIYNTVVGHEAGYSLNNNENVHIGFYAGRLSTGGENTFVGSQSGGRTTASSASECVAVGRAALYNLTSGARNTALGHEAGFNLLTGFDNTLVGQGAGDSLTTGSYNVVIGRLAGQAATAMNYATIIGRTAGIAHTSGAEPMYIGYDAGQQVTSGNYNTAIGTSSMTYGNGDQNCYVGFHAGFGANGNTSNYNTAVGANALRSVNGGSQNVAIGRAAAYNISTANYNTSVGYQAGNANTGSDYNTFIGGLAGRDTTGENNTYVGAIAGRFSTSGNRNTIVGSQAVDNQVLTGSDNTVVGFTAGQNLTSGYDNILLGKSSGLNINTGTANIGIGILALRYAQNAGNIAIGYSAAGGTTVSGGSGRNIAIGDAAMYNLQSGQNNIAIGWNAGRSGSQTPQSLGAITTNSNEIQMGNTSHTGAYIQIGWTTVSDARDKGQIKDVPHGLDFVNQLQPKSFEFKPDREAEETDGIERYGFLAQDVLELEGENPVVVNKNDEHKLKMTNDYLVPILVNAIKELKAEIDTLKSQIQ